MAQYCNHSDLTKGLIYGCHSIHLGININLLNVFSFNISLQAS